MTVCEENDTERLTWGSGSDRYYTQGLRIAAVFDESQQPELAEAVDNLPTPFAGGDTGCTTKVGLAFGQNMYTPECITCDPPDPADRPYAGWLYVGVLHARQWFAEGDDDRTGDVQIGRQVDLGVVGPSSFAEQTQIEVHRLVGAPRPRGWDHQLKDEPGLDYVHDYRWRALWSGDPDGLGFDVIPSGLVSLGNVDTHGEVGFTCRLGWRLPRDFGVSSIQTSAIEGKVEPTESRRPSIHLFAGGTGRVVGRNVFLDGNTFRNGGPSVDKKHLVGDLRAGVAIEWRSIRIAYAAAVRSKEFHGQRGSQKWGSIQVGYSLEF